MVKELLSKGILVTEMRKRSQINIALSLGKKVKMLRIVSQNIVGISFNP